MCFRGRGLEKCRDKIAIEESFDFIVNGSLMGRFSCSPGLYEEFALGFLVSSGFRVVNAYNVAMVNGKLNFTGRLERVDLPPPSTVRFKLAGIRSAVESLASIGVAFQETGALHGVACFSPDGDLLAHVEDVSRHCAVDKCLGLMVKSGHDLRQVGLAVTCRVTRSIAEKLMGAGVPLIASKAAPTLQGVISAENAGITLIGFMRGDRFNVYSHPERIIL